ncbi:cytochrome P450 [Streptomyces sp. ODS05-4]|uniref:cytochrome P450 n=1 Tax=Streptomyces sp. ODS05-4 TaxID=2944939 RepID=UPI00210ACACF|nr:cytochrome P450 [Streptomyces sp. ODS05-4]
MGSQQALDRVVVILRPGRMDHLIRRSIGPDWEVRDAGLHPDAASLHLDADDSAQDAVNAYFATPRAPTRAVLLGYGPFGSAALEFADAHPERVIAVVALDLGAAAGLGVELLCPVLTSRSADTDTPDLVGEFVAGLEAAPAPRRVLTPVELNDPDVVGRLRDAGPAHEVDGLAGGPLWLLTGHDATRAALDDPGLAGEWEMVPRFRRQRGWPATTHRGEKDLVTIEAEEHRRLRRIISAHLNRTVVDLMAPRLRREAERLLDRLPERRPVDFVASFAKPFPVAVLCELVGIPPADRDYVQDWLLRRVTADPDDPHDDIDRYLLDLVESRRHRPGEDFIGSVLRADGTPTAPRDIVAAVRLLMLSGLRAPTTLLATGVAALLGEPKHWERAAARPATLPAVVEELLRYIAPFPLSLVRTVAAPVTVGDTSVPRGSLVAASLVAANRDPRIFAHPDRLDPEREHNPHLSFGGGHHSCLGAGLARAQLLAALETLLRRHPRAALADHADSLRYRASSVRYLFDLSVVLGPRTS